jgi:hypothetical protein
MYSQRLGAPAMKIPEWTFAASLTHTLSILKFFYYLSMDEMPSLH